MQNTVSFVNDFWQYRMNRIKPLTDGTDLCEIRRHFWSSFRQDQHSLSAGQMRFEALLFDKGLTFTEAFVDLSIEPDPLLHKYKMISSHAALRTALADSNYRKTVGVVPGNFRELNRDEVELFCKELVDWFDAAGKLYISPFCQVSDIFRNWLKGVYSSVPKGRYDSLFAVEQLLSDKRSLLVESANSLVNALAEPDKDLAICVVGQGLYAESIEVTLGLNGFACQSSPQLPEDKQFDMVLLVGSGTVINQEIAEQISETIIVEMLPEQIDPAADAVLHENDNTVIYDLLISSAEEMVEGWLLSGKGVSTWEHCLALKMQRLVSEVLETSKHEKINTADALLLVALKRLKDVLIN